MATNTGAIGVFDSGVGGLSVAREIRAELPGEDILYVADSTHFPYGEKSAGFIQQRSLTVAEFLRRRGAKALVVACNTATGAAIMALRNRFSVPIVGMEPAVKPATQVTRSGVVGVLATSGTAASSRFANLLARLRGGAAIHVQPCSGLAERVEAGDLTGEETRALLEKYLAPLLARGADTIVLGCTHYSFLRPLVQQMAGPAVTIVDPNRAVARELRRRLAADKLLSDASRAGTEQFWTSAGPEQAGPVMSRLWGAAVEVRRLPEGAPADILKKL